MAAATAAAASEGGVGGGEGGGRHGITTFEPGISRVQCAPASMETATSSVCVSGYEVVELHITVVSSTTVTLDGPLSTVVPTRH